MSFTLNKVFKTNTVLVGCGNILNGQDLEISIVLSDPDVNTLTIQDSNTNELITVHEVVFKTTCEGQIQGGYITQVVEDENFPSLEAIIEAAKKRLL